jgi:hypothetical protein
MEFVFSFLTVKNAVFWDMTPCRSCVRNEISEGRVSLIFKVDRILERRKALAVGRQISWPDANAVPRPRILSALKMEVTRAFGTSVLTRPTRCHIAEDVILHVYSCLKFAERTFTLYETQNLIEWKVLAGKLFPLSEILTIGHEPKIDLSSSNTCFVPLQFSHLALHLLKKRTPRPLVRKRTIPTERPPLVSEI